MEDRTHPNLEIELYQQHQEETTRRNYLFYIKIGMMVYPLWSLMDSMLSEKSLLFFFSLRMAFIIPMLVLYLSLVKNRAKDMNRQFLYMLILSGLGQSIVSYFLGGLPSDYYNGLILMSFIQFTVMPGNSRYVAYLDIAYFLLYFPLNYFPFEVSNILAIKQTILYINYAVFKYICARRAYKLIYGSLNQYSLTKELENNKEVSNLFGELCHLISNPLFIAMATLKRNQKVSNPEEKAQLVNRSIDSLERIENVVKKMQHFYRTQDFELRKYKQHLNSEDSPSKKNP